MLVEVNGGKVEVQVRGSGELVVLVASLGRGAEDFAALMDDLEAAGYRAAGVNHRGVGGSSPAVDGLTLHDFADDVARAIEHLSDGPAHLVGHAYGNRVVRCLASDRPELVRSVTLIAAGGQVPPAPETRAALERIFELDRPEEERLADIQHAFFSPGHDPSVWLDGWYPETQKMQWQARDLVRQEEWGHAGVRRRCSSSRGSMTRWPFPRTAMPCGSSSEQIGSRSSIWRTPAMRCCRSSPRPSPTSCWRFCGGTGSRAG